MEGAKHRLPGGPFGKALDAVLLRRINVKTIDRMIGNLRGMVR